MNNWPPDTEKVKTRAEVAAFISKQFADETDTRRRPSSHHYGKQELRELMDFIYGQTPETEDEMIVGGSDI